MDGCSKALYVYRLEHCFLDLLRTWQKWVITGVTTRSCLMYLNKVVWRVFSFHFSLFFSQVSHAFSRWDSHSSLCAYAFILFNICVRPSVLVYFIYSFLEYCWVSSITIFPHLFFYFILLCFIVYYSMLSLKATNFYFFYFIMYL